MNLIGIFRLEKYTVKAELQQQRFKLYYGLSALFSFSLVLVKLFFSRGVKHLKKRRTIFFDFFLSF